MNKVVLMGRLTKDVEVRVTGNGTAVANFTLAVNKGYVKQGEERQADFISCIAWAKTAELMEKYTSKGRQIAVEGRIETSNYEKDGKRIYKTDVVVEKFYFADSKQEQGMKLPEWDDVKEVGSNDEASEELPF